MGYYIFFDESGKIDRQNCDYSYYGALGIRRSDRKKINEIIEKAHDVRELHFQKFSLHKIDTYLEIINGLLEVSKFNVYLVENEKALSLADKLGIQPSMLRELLYIKIPERLMYGILRYLDEFHNIKIIIDESDEYDKYKIEEKLKYQLNAQSVYRNKRYMIQNVEQRDSKRDVCLQGIDVILGIISFLVDKKYISYREELNEKDYEFILNMVNEDENLIIQKSYNLKGNQYKLAIKGQTEELEKLIHIYEKYKFYTQSSIQKAEFIYRLLNNEDKLVKFSKIEMFIWNESDKIGIKNITDFISSFILFKTRFDEYNKMLILKFYKDKKSVNFNEYEEILGFGRNSSKILNRYLDDLKIKLE